MPHLYTQQTSGLPNNNGVQNPVSILPDYDILDASVAFSFSEDKYRVTLIGKNLGDESFITTGGADGFRYAVPTVILACRLELTSKGCCFL